MLPNFFLLFSCLLFPLSLALFQMPQFQKENLFLFLSFCQKKRHLSVREFLSSFFICPEKIVSPLISSFSPPFVLHALLSFRSFHFYPQMTFYVPSVASLSLVFLSILLQSHIHSRMETGRVVVIDKIGEWIWAHFGWNCFGMT